MLRLIRLTIICLIYSTGLAAQVLHSGNTAMRFLTQEEGLTGESVTRIITDHQGAVWAATSNGVNHYNGQRLKTFVVPRSGVSRNYAFDICEGDDHAIYLGTNEGVFALKPGTNRFVRVAEEVTRAECVAHSGTLLYAGNREGLWVISGEGKPKTIKVGNTPMGLENSVRDIKVDAQGTVWFLSRYALNSYNPRTGNVSTLQLANAMPSGSAFSRLAILGKRFFIGTKNNGLFYYDLSQPNAVQVPDAGNVINSLYATHDGKLCVGTDGMGAKLYDGKTLQVLETFSTTASDEAHRLPTEGAYCYYRDKNDVDWFGFFRYGMAHTYHRSPLFNTYSLGEFSTAGMEVRSLLVDGDIRLIGASQGLYIANEQTGTVSHMSAQQLGGMHIITDIKKHDGRYYVASYDAGVRELHLNTLSVSPVGTDPLLTSATVISMSTSPTGQLWLLTGEGTFVMEPDGKMTRYTEHNSRLTEGASRSVAFTKEGTAWLTTGMGVCMYNTRTRQIDAGGFPADFFDKERNLTVSAGADGRYYFTGATGIYYTDASLSKYGRLSLPPGIMKENIYAFLDEGSHYWLGTESGLYRTNHEMGAVQQFGYGEGFNSLFVSGRGLQLLDGTLWACTAGGLYYVDLKALSRWQNASDHHVVLFDMERGGRHAAFEEEQEMNETRLIQVKWNIYSQPLHLTPILTDFARPLGRQYEYRLDGSDQWHMVRGGTSMVIHGLMMGSHRLEVRLAGAPGTASVYTLQVVPSFFAIVEMLLFIAACIAYIWWRRYRSATNTLLAEKKEMEEALLETETQVQEIMMKEHLDEALAGEAAAEGEVPLTVASSLTQAVQPRRAFLPLLRHRH